MKKLQLKDSTKEALAGYGFLLPNFIGFLIFTSIPVLASLVLSFMDIDLISTPKTYTFVWFENFKTLLFDPFFWKYCWNTVVLMAAIPFSMAGSLFLALLLNERLKGVVFFRTIYFLPTICSGVAIYILWRLIYNPDFGVLNAMISKFGSLLGLTLRGPNWLTDEVWAKPALIIMSVWQMVGGYNMIIYLAALQGVPRDLYEAAEIDGANSWQKFWAITWPQISPATFFIAIMSIIGGFQAGFDQAYILTGGGPNGATTTIMYYIFNNFYKWQEEGYAAAISWVLFLIIFAVTLFKWKVFGQKVHY
jgi:multiple sugar transport system permease protein